MRKYLIIPLLILSVGFCQQKKNDKPNPMKGVKTQTVIVYVYETLIRKNISKYDSNGNKVEDSRYDSEGYLTKYFILISKTISIIIIQIPIYCFCTINNSITSYTRTFSFFREVSSYIFYIFTI